MREVSPRLPCTLRAPVRDLPANVRLKTPAPSYFTPSPRPSLFLAELTPPTPEAVTERPIERRRVPRVRRSRLSLLLLLWGVAAWAGACSPAPSRGGDRALAEVATAAPHEEPKAAPPTAPDVAPKAAPMDEANAKTRYLVGPLHSPMTKPVIERIAAVLARSPQRRNVFIKVGDSHSVSPSFLGCFAGKDVDLGPFSELEPSLGYFHGWSRESEAAKVGWHAVQTLGPPLRAEIDAMRPAWAVLMLGTNDTRQTPPQEFERYLVHNVDALLAEGVVPIVSTIPPRGDTEVTKQLVPEMNAIVRAVAQSRKVPLVDLYGTLSPLPGLGLTPDGIHLDVFTTKGVHGCWLTEDGLHHGMNQRNLLTLAALDRMRRFVLEGEPAEPPPPQLEGAGTWQQPTFVDALPFADDGDTLTLPGVVTSYGACGDADGGEAVYRIDLDAPTRLRIRVFGDDGVEVGVRFLDGGEGDGATSCVSHAEHALEITAAAGAHRIVVDGPRAKAGNYRLTVVSVPLVNPG